jgi:predicted GIY-YIG superfamily endonuclease
MYYVYAIYNNERNKIYIGQTEDLSKRLKRHNQEIPTKSSSYTKKISGTWVLIYNEPLQTRAPAEFTKKN